jgi:hypothetical protein
MNKQAIILRRMQTFVRPKDDGMIRMIINDDGKKIAQAISPFEIKFVLSRERCTKSMNKFDSVRLCFRQR